MNEGKWLLEAKNFKKAKRPYPRINGVRFMMMKMNKQGAELSMNVIIIAAIALLVLVILAVLIFGAGDSVNKGTSCEELFANKDGQCESSCGDGKTYNPAGKCSDGLRCCVDLFGNEN